MLTCSSARSASQRAFSASKRAHSCWIKCRIPGRLRGLGPAAGRAASAAAASLGSRAGPGAGAETGPPPSGRGPRRAQRAAGGGGGGDGGGRSLLHHGGPGAGPRRPPCLARLRGRASLPRALGGEPGAGDEERSRARAPRPPRSTPKARAWEGARRKGRAPGGRVKRDPGSARGRALGNAVLGAGTALSTPSSRFSQRKTLALSDPNSTLLHNHCHSLGERTTTRVDFSNSPILISGPGRLSW